MKNNIVAGIDVSKRFSDLCVLSVDNSILRELHFTYDHFGLKLAAEILKKIETQQKTKLVLIMESTSHYHRLPILTMSNSFWKLSRNSAEFLPLLYYIRIYWQRNC